MLKILKGGFLVFKFYNVFVVLLVRNIVIFLVIVLFYFNLVVVDELKLILLVWY